MPPLWLKTEQDVSQYVDDVLSGRIVAGKWVKQACRRHLHDLQHAHERGLRLDWRLASKALLFARCCRHYQGPLALQNFDPLPWQRFFLASVFGWVREDGSRRFRKVHLEVARKNGKTYLCSVMALYLLGVDREQGAEVYSVATKRDQASKCLHDAGNVVRTSPLLKAEYRCLQESVRHVGSKSLFRALARDSNTLDGLNIHGVICDELHAWKSRDLWHVINTAFGARRQPLLVSITTAGSDLASLCYEEHAKVKRVLNRQEEDDALFGLIYSLDNPEEVGDESQWIKANPNLGSPGFNAAELAAAVEEAKRIPSRLNSLLRLRCNLWTQSETRWLSPAHWAACGGPIGQDVLAELVGRKCHAGLDLSRTQDLTALVLVFPPTESGGLYYVLCWCWCPAQSIETRSRKDSVPYELFARRGELTPTSGPVVDYDAVFGRIIDASRLYKLQSLQLDPWNAKSLSARLLDAGIPVVEHRQGYASMTAPTTELERLIVGGRLRHGDNSLLTWQAGNVQIEHDDAGNVKPSKARSSEKIDAIVALIMATGAAVADRGDAWNDLPTSI